MMDMKISRFAQGRGSLRRGFVAALAVAAGLTVATPATPAFAANYTSCESDGVLRTYLAWIKTSTGSRVCFANAGSMKMNVYRVTDFHTGNNKVTFQYTIEENGHQNHLTLDKWKDHTLTFGLHAHVTDVVIW
ncbi:beta/gamma crystallin domain-containing protein [Umezawaea beigongshangensis]|uniref:beta/gamma crystallin domain-containing protein n=1 Tax=Umezawaea beigongshangensis TaxID=2780383 RepID=UPI0018F14D5C|nr:beta/gamma crystallin domain-containing protein [Umezawaea beigongshangensis]